MELKDTIEGMTSADYKERFKAEYQQVKIRYNKLVNMIEKYKQNKLAFKLKTSLETLESQEKYMYHYMMILKIRALEEDINLGMEDFIKPNCTDKHFKKLDKESRTTDVSEIPCKRCSADKGSCCGCPEYFEWKRQCR